MFIPTVLPADTPAIGHNLRIWSPVLDHLDELSESDKTVVAAFLFALALRSCEPIAVSLLRESFQFVYDAEEHERLDYEYWRPIEIVAPALSTWRWWDRCERSCAAIVDRFMACNWDPADMLRAIRRVETLEQVFGLAKTTKARKQFLKRVAKIGLEMPYSVREHRILESHK
jgi:hypothetical protein